MGLIVSVVGLAGAGKSEAVAALRALHPYAYVYFGGVVMEEVARRGLPVGEASERAVRTALRAEHGMAAMAVLRRPAIDAHLAEGRDVLIDGLYSYSELQLLRGAYGAALTLIAVHAPRRLRVARLGGRVDRPLTEVEMDARDASEIEHAEKGPPIALAEHHIVNDGDLAILRAAVARIHAEITGSAR